MPGKRQLNFVVPHHISYTQNGKLIKTYQPMEAKILDINKKTLMDVWCTKTDDYITKMHIMPIAVSNEISSCYPKGIF